MKRMSPQTNNYGTSTPAGVDGTKFDAEEGFKGHKKIETRMTMIGSAFEGQHAMHPKAYFTEFTLRKAFIYILAILYVVGCAVASVAELFLTLPCPESENQKTIEYANPEFDASGCPGTRQPLLLGMTPLECSFGRRLVLAILMGGVIGWERRQADRPAGIRTMSLVSLGSCLFTINSAFAFRDGPMEWDASRIAAAIPSGVGFLGAGLIFKKSSDEDGSMVVHGLTTAASVWLSAAVGIACGGELYFAATFGTCLMMLLLRFGPRGTDDDDDDDEEDDDDDDDDPDENRDKVAFNEGLEVPAGGDSSPTLIFKNSDGSKIFSPGMQSPKPVDLVASVGDASTRGEFTVTGESIEGSTTEMTPMLQNLQQLAQDAITPKAGDSLRSQNQQKRKSTKIRKRQSKPNLGTLL